MFRRFRRVYLLCSGYLSESEEGDAALWARPGLKIERAKHSFTGKEGRGGVSAKGLALSPHSCVQYSHFETLPA